MSFICLPFPQYDGGRGKFQAILKSVAAENLSEALTQAVVRRLAGDDAWQAGLELNASGIPELVKLKRDSVAARVREWAVDLSSDEGVLQYSCTCPAGAEAEFCEHCAGAAFAWLDQQKAAAEVQQSKGPAPKKKAKSPGGKKRLNLADALELLQQEEEKEGILEALRQWADADTAFAQKVILFASRRADPAARISVITKLVKDAIRVRGVRSFKAGAWTRGISLAMDQVDELVRDGQAEAVIAICESGLQQLETTMLNIWQATEHYDLIRDRIETVHARACMEVRPDPVELAERLYAIAKESRFGILASLVERYAVVLGKKGLNLIRQRVEVGWNQLSPVLTYSDWSRRPSSAHKTQQLMESLVRQSGDVDELVRVMSKDLSSGVRYHEIADRLVEAGRLEEALALAEQGVERHKQDPYGGLHMLMTELMGKLGRQEDVLRTSWTGFETSPNINSWNVLRSDAQAANEWPVWRDKAIALLRENIEPPAGKRSDARTIEYISSCRALLPNVLLQEGFLDKAWKQAKKTGATSAVWLQLAFEMEEALPLEAMGIYYAEGVELAKYASNVRQNEEAFVLLERAGDMAAKAGEQDRFSLLLDDLASKLAWNRGFLKLLKKYQQQHPG